MENKFSQICRLKEYISTIEWNISNLIRALAKRQIESNYQHVSKDDTIENLEEEIESNKIYLKKLNTELVFYESNQ